MCGVGGNHAECLYFKIHGHLIVTINYKGNRTFTVKDPDRGHVPHDAANWKGHLTFVKNTDLI